VTFGLSQIAPQGAKIPKAAGRKEWAGTRERFGCAETELHAPDHFYLGPPNPAENESTRIMRHGKKGGKATGVLVAKEVVGGGTRGSGEVGRGVSKREQHTSRIVSKI